jgi:hypothetical protein
MGRRNCTLKRLGIECCAGDYWKCPFPIALEKLITVGMSIIDDFNEFSLNNIGFKNSLAANYFLKGDFYLNVVG